MKSEFLPMDNRGAAAGGDRGHCDETGEGRWGKKICRGKTIGTSTRSADREWILRFPRAFARMDTARVHILYACTFIAQLPRRASENGRVSKRARRPIVARQTAAPPKPLSFSRIARDRLYRTNCRLEVRELFRPFARKVCERLEMIVLREPVTRATPR